MSPPENLHTLQCMTATFGFFVGDYNPNTYFLASLVDIRYCTLPGTDVLQRLQKPLPRLNQLCLERIAATRVATTGLVQQPHRIGFKVRKCHPHLNRIDLPGVCLCHGLYMLPARPEYCITRNHALTATVFCRSHQRTDFGIDFTLEFKLRAEREMWEFHELSWAIKICVSSSVNYTE